MQTLAQRPALSALKFDQPMRDVVFVQEIVELMSITRAARSEHTQPCKLAIATQPASSHDQRVHDWLADPGQLGQGAPELSRWHVKDFGLVRCYPRCRERRRTLQHRDVADEIALVRDRQFLFDVVALLDHLYFAAQYNRQTEVPLTGFVDHISPLHDTALCQWLKQRKLVVVQFPKSDTFRVPIKLFVLLFVRRHFEHSTRWDARSTANLLKRAFENAFRNSAAIVRTFARLQLFRQ